MTIVDELRGWLHDPNAARFPYAAVLQAIRAVGKSAVQPELLAMLDKARHALAQAGGCCQDRRQLAAFLDVALDRWDGRFDAPSYLALRLLPLPETDSPDLGEAWRRHDELIPLLIADLLMFDTAGLMGTIDLLPQHRPDQRLVAKRHRLGVSAATPALTRRRLSHRIPPPHSDVDAGWAELVDQAPTQRRLELSVSMLPVGTFHDEWLFIRILQAYEAVFSLMAVQLRAAVSVLAAGNPRMAAVFTDGAATALREAAPLFSLMATMRKDSFAAFRVYTHGASAIQSHAAKLVEALCRAPDSQRLDSPAYQSVPAVRQAVRDGQVVGLEDVYLRQLAADAVEPRHQRRMEQAMTALADVLDRWRRTHHQLAVRFLGDQAGTAGTEGPAYLAAVRTIPIFRTVADDGRRTQPLGCR